MTDKNGTPITVGATVKLVGTVVSINNASSHYDGCVIRLSFPASNLPFIPSGATAPGVPNVNTSKTGPAAPNPQFPALIAADGSQLIVGS